MNMLKSMELRGNVIPQASAEPSRLRVCVLPASDPTGHVIRLELSRTSMRDRRRHTQMIELDEAQAQALMVYLWKAGISLPGKIALSADELELLYRRTL